MPTWKAERPQVQTLVHVDGQGAQAVADTWRTIRDAGPAGMPLGWKNFLHMDWPMLTPGQTMAVS